MAIQIHPEQGTILICDFKGFVQPEMLKRRPVVVISPRLRKRGNLCSIVPLSTTAPKELSAFHYRLHVNPPLPAPFDESAHWVKADMIYTVSFDRLYLPFRSKDGTGKRIYDVRVVDKSDLLKIQQCVLHGIGLTHLTDYL